MAQPPKRGLEKALFTRIAGPGLKNSAGVGEDTEQGDLKVGMLFVIVSSAAVLAAVIWFVVRLNQVERSLDSRLSGLTHFVHSPIIEDNIEIVPDSLREIVEESLQSHAAKGKAPVVRFRMLIDIKTGDPVLDGEFKAAQNNGDGAWLYNYLERTSMDDLVNHTLYARLRAVTAKGWRIVRVEPAYETSDGLVVAVMAERELKVRQPARRAA